ncbi:MAG TPA: rhomboid family intramembrane serine protease, partial [Planctomycetes bacterium]|nr:rhomboid family intramembrane serine protease [Planctomycetota bacterium]
IPLRDSEPSGIFPRVVIGVIITNVVVFLLQMNAQGGLIEVFGLRPALFLGLFTGETQWVEVTNRYGQLIRTVEMVPGLINAILPLFASIFLHGGLLHIGFNMWFLWIFGDNIEGLMGHRRFIGFYLCCGLIAGLAHTFLTPDSMVPTIGASGAVAGILGAYLRRFPHSRVLTLIPIFFFIHLIQVRAQIFLGLWFAFEVFRGLTGTAGMVAVWAHVGGFIAGWALIPLFESPTSSSRSGTTDVRFRDIR